MPFRPFSRTPRRLHSMASAMSAARQALNNSLGIDRIARPPMSIDPATLPPQRTVLESKYFGATYRVMRMVQRPDQTLPRATFHAGTDDRTRAVRLAEHLPDRAFVSTATNGGDEIIFDNGAPYGTE